MAQRSDTHRGLVVPAVCPDKGGLIEALIPHHRINFVRRLGVGAIRELGSSVPEVLKSPAAVWRGIRRDDDDTSGHSDGYLCYAGVPSFRYHWDTGEIIGNDDKTLLVFLNKELTVYGHRWEEADPRRKGYPLDMGTDTEDRFMEQRI